MGNKVKIKKMDMVLKFILTNPNILENGNKICITDKEHIILLMVVIMKVNGKIIRCMVMVRLLIMKGIFGLGNFEKVNIHQKHKNNFSKKFKF